MILCAHSDVGGAGQAPAGERVPLERNQHERSFSSRWGDGVVRGVWGMSAGAGAGGGLVRVEGGEERARSGRVAPAPASAHRAGASRGQGRGMGGGAARGTRSLADRPGHVGEISRVSKARHWAKVEATRGERTYSSAASALTARRCSVTMSPARRADLEYLSMGSRSVHSANPAPAH